MIFNQIYKYRLKTLIILSLCLFFIQCSSNRFYSNYSDDDFSVYYYEIAMDKTLFEKKILRLQTYKSLKFMNGQDLIGYDFIDSIDINSKEKYGAKEENGILRYGHYEATGQIKKKNSHWMHPPRAHYFKILEMNAFPYIVNNKKDWKYDLDFGEHWGDERWITWKGRRLSKTKYELSDKKQKYFLGNKKIKCLKIIAHTKIQNLGETESIFYYNEEYGFVYMWFKTINNQIIEFKML